MTRYAACGLLMICALTALALAEGGQPEMLGKPAPIVVLKTLDGSDFYLRDHCGQPRSPRTRQEREVLVMSFFTSWCKNCKNEIPVLQELASQLAGQPVKFFLVNVGQPKDTVENYVFQNVTTLPVLMDQYEVASKKYKVKELPTLVMIDKEGILKEYHTGFIPAFGDSIKIKVYSLLGMALPVAKVDSLKPDSAKATPKPAVKKKKKTNK